MTSLDGMEILFAVTAFLFQVVLIVHFALRMWRLGPALRFGPLVYALSVPASTAPDILSHKGSCPTRKTEEGHWLPR